MSLLVRPADQAEVMLEEIMAFKSEKLSRYYAASFLDHFGHGDLCVIVADPLRHDLEEFKCPTMALLERFRALPRKRLAKEGIAVRQRDHEKRYLSLLTAINDRRRAEIDLAFPRSVLKRHKDFSRPLLKRRTSSCTTVMSALYPYSLRRRSRSVSTCVFASSGAFLSASSISWITVINRPRTGFSRSFRLRYPGGSSWDNIFFSVSQCRSIDLAGLSLRQFAGQYPATHFAPKFHVRVHSLLPRGGVRFVTVIPLQVLLTLQRGESRVSSMVTPVGSVQVARSVEGQVPSIVNPRGEGAYGAAGGDLADCGVLTGNVQVARTVEGQALRFVQPRGEGTDGAAGSESC